MEAKHQYLIKCRLSPKAEFKLMGVNGRHPTFLLAQKYAALWIAGKSDLAKAKPEVIIESEELPYIRDCVCGEHLFKGDIVYFDSGNIYCYNCSIRQKLNQGFYDNLYENEQDGDVYDTHAV